MTTASNAPSGSLVPLRAMAADIKLAHSVFALPFAVLGAVMAGARQDGTLVPGFAGMIGLVIAAMVFARTGAMLANRLIDREIDARNPRTRGRALPSGRASVRGMAAALAGSVALFMLVCGAFQVCYDNPWPLILGLPVLGWLCAYGWLKRFTAWCHVYLGASLAMSPVAAAIAVVPSSLASQPSLWLLAGMVLGWVAGFDIIYALQDVEADRSQGLHSVPARLGVRGGMAVSRALHLLSAALLIAVWRADTRFGALFAIGAAAVIALLIVEHITVRRWGTTRIALAFFTLNGVISCLLGALGVADLLLL